MRLLIYDRARQFSVGKVSCKKVESNEQKGLKIGNVL